MSELLLTDVELTTIAMKTSDPNDTSWVYNLLEATAKAQLEHAEPIIRKQEEDKATEFIYTFEPIIRKQERDKLIAEVQAIYNQAGDLRAMERQLRDWLYEAPTTETSSQRGIA